LKNLPIKLPSKASFSIQDIFTTSPQDSLYSSIKNISFRQLDSVEVFRSLNILNGNEESYLCVECAQIISMSSNGAQIGHASYCSKNPNRHIEWCEECKRDLKKYGTHAPNCPRIVLENIRKKVKR
jgi:hypothetical protein